jgi:hypothetical protein
LLANLSGARDFVIIAALPNADLQGGQTRAGGGTDVLQFITFARPASAVVDFLFQGSLE